jgi:glycosyltransferase involved in cell wall biosynthesis
VSETPARQGARRPKEPRVLLVISVREPDEATRAEINAGRQPRRDFDELQRVLGADVLYLDSAPPSRLARLARRLLGVRIGPRVGLAFAAFALRERFDIIFTDTDSVGLPLALLLKLCRVDPASLRHVTLSHNLSSMRNRWASVAKRALFRCGITSHIDTMIVHSSAQRVLASGRFGVPVERVVQLPYQVDAAFWNPAATGDHSSTNANRAVIPVPGHECRDYPTLLEAIRGLEVEAKISTRSLTAEQDAMASRPEWPENLRFAEYDYPSLRELYARSRFVLVPLLPVDFQAGITVVLEAMAMGKAVIITGIRGQTDVVRDPRGGGRGPVERDWWPGFVESSDVAESLGVLPTGLYVTPGDAGELRSAIEHLLEHPEEAEQMGRNGRAIVESLFTVEAFAERFAQAIRGEIQPSRTGLPWLTTYQASATLAA